MKLLNSPYQFTLIDLQLPKTDGLTLLKKARNKGIQSPILTTATEASTEEGIHSLNIGADDFLKQPFQTNELLARIRALLRRGDWTYAPSVTLNDIEIDFKSGHVLKGGQGLHLTAIEFKIIDILVSKRGSIISRYQLQESITDDSDDSTSNLLDVHICHIRKKLGKDFVRTIRSRGYIVDRP